MKPTYKLLKRDFKSFFHTKSSDSSVYFPLKNISQSRPVTLQVLNSHTWPVATIWNRAQLYTIVCWNPYNVRSAFLQTIHRKDTVPSYKDSTLVYQLETEGERRRPSISLLIHQNRKGLQRFHGPTWQRRKLRPRKLMQIIWSHTDK